MLIRLNSTFSSSKMEEEEAAFGVEIRSDDPLCWNAGFIRELFSIHKEK